MHILVLDDKKLVVDGVLRILKRIDPNGEHWGTSDCSEALELIKEQQIDIVFLDIEMPEASGITMAKKMSKINPTINIIFITGYADYALDAHKVYASSYLMKPITEDDVVDALVHLRYQPMKKSDNKIEVRCFGVFEVLCNGKPVEFKRKKTKELFAYLVDRKGASCDVDMLIGSLWPDEPASASKQSLLRNLIADLRKSFREIGEEDIIIKMHNGLGLNTHKFDCDYYDFLRGDPKARHKYSGEYMSQYDLGEITRAYLDDTTI